MYVNFRACLEATANISYLVTAYSSEPTYTDEIVMILSKVVKVQWMANYLWLQKTPLMPYIDRADNAFAPVRFTNDTAALSSTETISGWQRNVFQISLFPSRNNQGQETGGLQWVATERPGVVQLYWNETLARSGLQVPAFLLTQFWTTEYMEFVE
jgi:hypothetical protein